jgi:hypothetical protein
VVPKANPKRKRGSETSIARTIVESVYREPLHDWKNDFDSNNGPFVSYNVNLAISGDEINMLSKDLCDIQLKLNYPADKKKLDKIK